MNSTKSFSISKHKVLEAYKYVKANKGAAGVDNESIQEFEQHLKRNLYKIWNRLSSGSYFPPPVKRVEIPKKSGGKRYLGIPTVSDRVAQMVVKLYIEPIIDIHFHPDSSAIALTSPPKRRSRLHASDVGSMTGWWNLILKGPLTIFTTHC